MPSLKYRPWNKYKFLYILERKQNKDKNWKSKPILKCKCDCWLVLDVWISKIINYWYCWIKWRHRDFKIKDDYVEIQISNWEYTKIDIDDFEKVRNHSWVKTKHKYIKWWGYVHANIKWKYIKLHKFVTWYKFVDHINRDPLDNRKSNLRLSNSFLNAQNTKNNINITFNNKTQSLIMWSKELWINKETLRYNFHRWKHISKMIKAIQDHWLNYKWPDLD